MAAATRPIVCPMPADYSVREHDILFAGALVPLGTLACNDAGKVKPATDALIQGGALLLGFALDTYDAVGSATDKTLRMLFAHACQWKAPAAKGGDVPTKAEIGKAVSIQDNQTTKKTVAAGDVSLTLEAIHTDGYVLYLP
jgi:hypothetical protein